jgi:hypothetical protein
LLTGLDADLDLVAVSKLAPRLVVDQYVIGTETV